jgi:hypothetical protein
MQRKRRLGAVAAGAAVVAATVLGVPGAAHATGNGQVSCSQSTNGRTVSFDCWASGTNAVKFHGWCLSPFFPVADYYVGTDWIVVNANGRKWSYTCIPSTWPSGWGYTKYYS